MAASMSAAAHPSYANVLFLRVPRFPGLTVAAQAAAKERLESRVRKALGALPDAERVVLDAEDGLALVVFGEPERARELVTAGNFTDTRVRQHTFYGHDARRGVLARRRSLLRTAGIVVAILLAGVVGRDIYQPRRLSRPAIVKLDVRSGSEVLVDGVAVGRVPPLTQVEVAPGSRRIEIRNPGFVPYDVTREFKPGEKAAIAHTFPRPPASKGGGAGDLWKDFKRSFTK